MCLLSTGFDSFDFNAGASIPAIDISLWSLDYASAALHMNQALDLFNASIEYNAYAWL